MRRKLRKFFIIAAVVWFILTLLWTGWGLLQLLGISFLDVGVGEGRVIGLQMLAFSLGPVVIFIIAAIIAGRGLRGPHQCRKCGYDIRATQKRCPECGTRVDAS